MLFPLHVTPPTEHKHTVSRTGAGAAAQGSYMGTVQGSLSVSLGSHELEFKASKSGFPK